VQEIVDMTAEAFDLADIYRTPVMILADGMLGQMMEPVVFEKKESKRVIPEKTWATTGTEMKREHNVINSLYIEPNTLEKLVLERYERYKLIEETECKYEAYKTEDAEFILTGYGSVARICKNAVDALREQGIKAGLIRPITLWPFPSDAYINETKNAKAILTVEMSMGQMVEDVKLSVNGKVPVHFFGRTGGNIPYPNEVIEAVKKIIGGDK